LHINAAENKSASGVEICIPEFSAQNNLKNKTIGASMLSRFDQNKIDERGIKTADFYVQKNVQCLEILVELGFMSNSRELENLQSVECRSSLCSALVNGIELYVQ
tara:strand:+ start:105 stop:419 length:315 start_codon:yes stop_codon:yes gene_type:complete